MINIFITMIEFLKKNQKNITMGASVVLLLICYFQQKELAKLRKEVQVVKEINLDSIQDSHLNILNEK